MASTAKLCHIITHKYICYKQRIQSVTQEVSKLTIMFNAWYSELTSLQFLVVLLACSFNDVCIILIYLFVGFQSSHVLRTAVVQLGDRRHSGCVERGLWSKWASSVQPCQISRTVSKKECKVRFKCLFAPQTYRHPWVCPSVRGTQMPHWLLATVRILI